MIRPRLAVQGPPPATMNCEAARNGLADLLGGPIPLTEWALLESHLRGCRRCRQVEVRLRELVAAARRPVAPSQRVLAVGRDIAPRARAGVMWTRGLAVRGAGDLMARLRPASVVAVDAVRAGRRAISRSARRVIRARPSARTVGTVLALALTVCALPGTNGPRPRALSPTPSSSALRLARLEASSIESARLVPAGLEPAEPAPVHQALSLPAAPVQPVSSVPAPAVEKRRTDPRRSAPLEAPSRTATRSSPDVSAPSPSGVRASQPDREATSSASFVGDLSFAASHVVGRLKARNPGAARRDVIALLADVGGTEVGRTSTAVAVVVPQSRYGEFAEGLARIGSWQLEAARSQWPDAVHMTIRLAD